MKRYKVWMLHFLWVGTHKYSNTISHMSDSDGRTNTHIHAHIQLFIDCKRHSLYAIFWPQLTGYKLAFVRLTNRYLLRPNDTNEISVDAWKSNEVPDQKKGGRQSLYHSFCFVFSEQFLFFLGMFVKWITKTKSYECTCIARLSHISNHFVKPQPNHSSM